MNRIPIPKTSERIRGISLPKDEVFYVCDYDEVFRVVIGKDEADFLDDNPYQFLDSMKQMIGVENRSLIQEVAGNSISYQFDPSSDYVEVECNTAGVKSTIKFQTLSGDWFGASFSSCGKYLILAEPYGIELYEVCC